MEKLSQLLATKTKASIDGQEPSLRNLLSRAFIGKLEGKQRSLQDLLLEGRQLITQHGQWTSVLNKHSYERRNLSSEGKEQFYTEVQGPYGNPFFIIERSKAFALPADLNYVNARNETVNPSDMTFKYKDLEGKEVIAQHQIGGIICQSAEPDKDDPRFSLSNPNFIEIAEGDTLENKPFVDGKGKPITYWQKTVDGIRTFQTINGQRQDRQWYLQVLFLKDKNRFGNFDAYYSLTKPEQVRILELADINFNKV